MPKVALVTDSTSYIPSELVTKYNITVMPQVLIWGEETFRDGVDIQPDEFYRRLEKASVMPSTSQVSPADVKRFSRTCLSRTTTFWLSWFPASFRGQYLPPTRLCSICPEHRSSW